jgi:hypothetical protein
MFTRRRNVVVGSQLLTLRQRDIDFNCLALRSMLFFGHKAKKLTMRGGEHRHTASYV